MDSSQYFRHDDPLQKWVEFALEWEAQNDKSIHRTPAIHETGC